MDAATQAPGAVRPGGFNQSFIDSRPTDPRKEAPQVPHTRVRMRVHNRNTLGLAIGTTSISVGTHEIVVREDEVSGIVAQVEDPALIEAARAQFAKDIAEEVGKNLPNPWMGTVPELQALIANRQNDDVNAAYDRVMRVTGNSVEKTFQQQNKRSMQPLSMAEVIKDSAHPSPENMAAKRQIDQMAEAISAALDRRMGAGAPSAADINALVEAKVKELLGEKAAGKR
jgi:hypothetical protein